MGVPPKIGRLTIYGEELTGMWLTSNFVFGIKDINSHIQILNLTSTNYYYVKQFENIDPVFQKQG